MTARTDAATHAASPRPIQITLDEARAIALRAQGLLAAPQQRGATTHDVLRRTGAVQLDTISVLARSHELVAYARLGPVPRAIVEAAYWGAPAQAFEYIAHAACILPIESWPHFAFRRRAYRDRYTAVKGHAFAEVRAHLREGPITVSELAGGGRNGVAGWWNWSASKEALEALWARGDVVVTTRSAWRRVYDLRERAIPAAIAQPPEPSDAECFRELVRQSARALGIGTRRDINEYFRLTTRHPKGARHANALLDAAIAEAGLVSVEAEGWREPAFADPQLLAATRGEIHRTTLLSPFDSLVWDRDRTERLFGFAFKLEAYVPKDLRQRGYFTMPLLAGGRIIGYADPAREGRTLIARTLSLQDRSSGTITAAASALREAASWVDCDDIRIERCSPAPSKRAVERALRA
jgi:uncharacterized protein YcaQ